MKLWRRGTSASYWRWNALAAFNSEVARGIMHTDEYKKRMAEEQLLFDDEQKRKAEKNGWYVLDAR